MLENIFFSFWGLVAAFQITLLVYVVAGFIKNRINLAAVRTYSFVVLLLLAGVVFSYFVAFPTLEWALGMPIAELLDDKFVG